MKMHYTLILLLSSIASGFTPLCVAQSITDLDGHTYNVVKIGSQTWMGQNLNVSRFRNGDPILEAKTDEAWEKAGADKKPVWCFYEASTENGKIYGKLYNWFAVNDPRCLAPKGWHIPSDKEWNTLSTALGGHEKSGGKLKEKGTTHWKSPNNEATNESGFTALPGGINYSFGTFVKMGTTGYWWTTIEDGDDTAILYSLNYEDNALFNLFLNKGVGISVRCLKD